MTNYQKIKIVAWITLFVGVIGIIYALNFDTTVISVTRQNGVFSTERVHNIGLLNDRQMLLILFSFILLIGVILLLYVNTRSPKSSELSGTGYLGTRDINSDAYRLFLVEKNHIQKNEVLSKYVWNGMPYDSLDELIPLLHQADERGEANKAISSEHSRKQIQKLTKITGWVFAFGFVILSIISGLLSYSENSNLPKEGEACRKNGLCDSTLECRQGRCVSFK